MAADSIAHIGSEFFPRVRLSDNGIPKGAGDKPAFADFKNDLIHDDQDILFSGRCQLAALHCQREVSMQRSGMLEMRCPLFSCIPSGRPVMLLQALCSTIILR
jgi:hypothetical protein